MTQINKETCNKELLSLARKQNCFDDMNVFNFVKYNEDILEVEIWDRNSYFKICNLLPSIGHSTQYLTYNYYDNRRWVISANFKDEQSVLQLVEIVTLIVETCMKAQSEFNKTFEEINYILG